MRQILLLVLTGLLVQGKILATSVQPPTWEHLASTSEFIGLVECVTAGGIVARHRIVESWKGAEVGIEMNISQRVDAFGPQFPISLVGERFLVFADTKSSDSISSITSGGEIPLWWRKIPVDLKGFSLVPLKEPFRAYLSSHIIGVQSGGLAEFKADVTNFLGAGKEEQEWRLMMATARKHLYRNNPESSSNANKNDIQLYDSLQDTKSVEELWQCIITTAFGLIVPAIPQASEPAHNQRYAAIFLSMLSEEGREKCRELLEKADSSKLPWSKKEVDQLASKIRWNISADDEKPRVHTDPHEISQKLPTPDEIAEAENLLSKPWDHQTGAAFRLLCRHAPTLVVPFLLEWEPPQERGYHQLGYLLGSAFGHLCSADRVKHLKDLRSAKDDWIRTSAAVYLHFDDQKEGKDALRKGSMIEGAPGAWAALVLSSRGEKSAMLRALEVFATRDDEMQTMIHRHLKDRLRVLLSNTANASGISQPPSSPKHSANPSEEMADQTAWHRSLVRWWQQNEEKLILTDPWAKILDEQRVD
jgi:hypothetical protein